jgi:hypothetical protein
MFSAITKAAVLLCFTIIKFTATQFIKQTHKIPKNWFARSYKEADRESLISRVQESGSWI